MHALLATPVMVRWLGTLALVLALSACHRIQPIYEVQGHPIPTSSLNRTAAQITDSIGQTAQAQGWLVDRLGPNELRATDKWKDHVAVVLISHDGATFSIRNDGSTHLLQRDGAIHKAYNERVRRLEAAIERKLYGSP